MKPLQIQTSSATLHDRTPLQPPHRPTNLSIPIRQQQQRARILQLEEPLKRGLHVADEPQKPHDRRRRALDGQKRRQDAQRRIIGAGLGSRAVIERAQAHKRLGDAADARHGQRGGEVVAAVLVLERVEQAARAQRVGEVPDGRLGLGHAQPLEIGGVGGPQRPRLVGRRGVDPGQRDGAQHGRGGPEAVALVRLDGPRELAVEERGGLPQVVHLGDGLARAGRGELVAVVCGGYGLDHVH